MNAGEKEIVDLMKEWKDQITKITVDYNSGISKLEVSRIDYENYKKKWWVLYKNFFKFIGGVIVLLGAFIIISKTGHWCKIEFSYPFNFTVSSSCSK